MIKAENITVCYRMANDKIQSIKEYLVALLKRKLKYDEFRALQDVSFEIEKGEVIGIVGSNGAGKSTLLKVISGILRPTTGSVTLEGNVVPMLELGSGFDFDLSGRENIFLNGAILGYSEKFLKEKYDEIVEFSELGEFIDIPVRNYSSGMIMRLAFSIASQVVPDILIVDEILAVGDAAFQEKSYARMMELMSHGTTVLLVSHNIDQVRRLCDRVIWLDHGKVVAIGETEELCDAYMKTQQR
ncbi:MAG: ABC transporter ATP-binding protein [Clostridia bacterium]|nr:ABC transporter ATP-binding protein [Clostridia bacterium]